MTEKTEFQGKIAPELTGLPEDLFSDPAKYDGEIPLWRRTVGLVNQYRTAKPSGREKLLGQLASEVVKNPANLVNVLNNLDLIGQVRSAETVAEIKYRMASNIEQAVRQSDIRAWTPAKIEGVIKQTLDSQGEIKAAYDQMVTALFNSPRTIEDAVDVQYNAAWAMLTTADQDVRGVICSILCFETKYFRPDSFAAYLNLLAPNGLTDDIHIERSVATNGAVGEITKLAQISKSGIDAQLSADHLMTSRFKYRELAPGEIFYSLPREEQVRRDDFSKRLIKKYAARYKIFQETRSTIPDVVHETRKESSIGVFEADAFFEEVGRRQKRDRSLGDIEWPNNLFFSFKEPLQQYITKVYGHKLQIAVWENSRHFFFAQGYKSLSEDPIQITDDLNLEIIGRGFETTEQKSAAVRKIINAITGGAVEEKERDTLGKLNGAIDAARNSDGFMVLQLKGLDLKFAVLHRLSEEESGKLASVIQFHRPLISLDQIDNASIQMSRIRQNIKNNFIRSVGIRGVETIIADPVIRQYGYRSITFKLDENRKNINTTIDIMGQEYNFQIDEDFRIVLGQDIKKFRSFQDQAWMELLTLSHLEKVMCTEEDKIEGELVGKGRQIEIYRIQTVNRSQHLRRLRPGQRFSSEAFEKCIKSDLPVKDLALINRARASINFGGTTETGMWTYVSPVEKVDAQSTKPVKVAFATATDDIRKIIPLGQITEEERERIEKEILAEFGVL